MFDGALVTAKVWTLGIVGHLGYRAGIEVTVAMPYCPRNKEAIIKYQDRVN